MITVVTLSILLALVLGALQVLLAVVIGRAAAARDTQIPRPTTEHDAAWWRDHTKGES